MKSRIIKLETVTKSVRDLCIKANTHLNKDVYDALKNSINTEKSFLAKAVLHRIIENAQIARKEKIPICQDTGFAVVFLEIGEDIKLSGKNLKKAVSEGVRQGYIDGYLRKSIIKDPITNPKNTKTNTPPIIHTEIVPGDKLKITIMPKGGGSENMSRIKMMTPADGVEGIEKFVIDTVKNAGANPCPPVIVGVGIGGTFDYVAYLAKKALLRKMGKRNSNKEIALLEKKWLNAVNKLGIGPAGLGGSTTALDLFIEVFPRHIASYPAAVNIQCHVARSSTKIL